MNEPIPTEVTQALELWNQGEAGAAEQLLPLVYAELRKLARRHLRSQRPDHTLQPTALVHEAYLKLAGHEKAPWKDRVHFYAVVAKIMRGILVDHARARDTAKRGGGVLRVPLEESEGVADPRAADFLALHDTLERLAALDPRKARIIELRFFGGLSIDETAQLLEVSAPTVVNETRKARAWLLREIAGREVSAKAASGESDP